jgi:hypothetical protein
MTAAKLQAARSLTFSLSLSLHTHTRRQGEKEKEIVATRLYSHRRDVDAENVKCLQDINTESVRPTHPRTS